ncbi:MAG: metal ABC transporter substrate-binding protein [Dehalococcoidia bacterium]|nr:metal ABC transporter substrate-binding protein [Dehalococcoidia bacterium]
MKFVGRPVRATLFGLVLALLLAACSEDVPSQGETPAFPSPPPLALSPSRADLPIRVAVTLPLFADFAREIGGKNVEVFSLFPAGADPHTYELTPEDISRIPEADVFFVNGLGLDTAVQELIEQNRKETAKVIPFGPNVPSPQAGLQGNVNLKADEAGDNLHLWLDPVIARSYVDLMADVFMIVDRVNEAFYRGNLAAYGDSLFGLDDEIKAQVMGIPEKSRRIVTYHDSFIHFANRYGLEVAAFAVSTPGEDPGPEDVDRLKKVIGGEGAPGVFGEVGFDNSVLEQIAAEAGVQMCTLYSDIQDESVPTYIGMMRADLAELVRCLGGEDGG